MPDVPRGRGGGAGGRGEGQGVYQHGLDFYGRAVRRILLRADPVGDHKAGGGGNAVSAANWLGGGVPTDGALEGGDSVSHDCRDQKDATGLAGAGQGKGASDEEGGGTDKSDAVAGRWNRRRMYRG